MEVQTTLIRRDEPWGAIPFVVSLYLQQLRGLSSLTTGVTFLPMMLIGASLTPFSARIAERLGTRLLITGGLVLMVAGLVILAQGLRTSLLIAAGVALAAASASLLLRPISRSTPA